MYCIITLKFYVKQVLAKKISLGIVAIKWLCLGQPLFTAILILQFLAFV